MRKLLVLAAIGGGVWHLSQNGLPTFSPVEVYDATGNPLVKVITIADCGRPCKMAIDELKRRRVAFEEIEIDPHDDNDNSEAFELWKNAGRDVFPLLVSGDQVINGSGTPAMTASLLARNFDDKYLTSTEKNYFKNHFNADGSPRVVVYGADWCPYTRKLRAQLEDDNVDYLMIDVDKHYDKKRMSKTMEIEGFPATWVGYTRARGSDIGDVRKVMNSY